MLSYLHQPAPGTTAVNALVDDGHASADRITEQPAERAIEEKVGTMRKKVATCKSALLGGAFALAATLPLSAVQADDLVRLDSAQLDTVTAGAFTLLGLSGESEAFGTVSSNVTSITRLTSTSSPFTSVSTGSQVNTAIGIGGVETPPTATTLAKVDDIAGQRLFIIPIFINGGGPGFQYSVNAVAAAAVASEFPIF